MTKPENKVEIRDRIKEFRRVPAKELLPNPKNWRTHPKAQQDALRGILEEVGYVDAIMARELPGGQLEIIDGHLRQETTPDTEVPVLIVDLDDAEAAKVLATFDPLAAMAQADAPKLDALLRECSTGSEALAGMLTDLAKEAGCEWAKPPGVVEDEVPEPPAVPVTKPGDLWLLGEHRLLCGDSTNAEDVGRLMGGRKIGLLFTSPPYAQQRDYGAAKGQVQDWDSLMRGVFVHAAGLLDSTGQILVNLGMSHRDGEWFPYWDGWIAWMREQGWRRFGWYVWDQGPGLPGDWSGRFAPAFEFVFHFNKQGVKPSKWVEKLPESVQFNDHGNGMRGKDGTMSGVSSPEASLQLTKIPDSVIRACRHKGRGIEIQHPAVFAVEFASYIVKSWPGIVYEPFSGSGTTIIAAEQLHRQVCAMELDPQYVDVALHRYFKLTGKRPKRESDGLEFTPPLEKTSGT